MRVNTVIYLVEVVQVQDPDTGTRTQEITGVSEIMAQKSQVGYNTYWQAAQAKIDLNCSVEIIARSYKKQKYLVIFNEGAREQYEIYNVANGSALHTIKLNLKAVNLPFLANYNFLGEPEEPEEEDEL
jgi:hypothetical protein